jgi:subtilisin family serine protease
LILRTHQHVRLRVGRRGHIEGDGGARLQRMLRDAGVTLSPLYAHPRAGAHQAVADLGCYFAVHAGGRAPDPELADRLREHELVEFAYPKPPVALPSASDGADLRGGQGYLEDAPGGIGARAVWKRPGGRGAGVRLIDVEGDWRFSHQDLGERFWLVGGRPRGDVTRRNHGTNVVGMLLGLHDERGVDGICPETEVRAVSYQPEERWGSAQAIAYAAGGLRPGDILLVEMQRGGPRSDPKTEDQNGYLPMSYWPDDLTAIQYAVGRGVIVVEAAGNGAQDLDDPIYAGRGPGFREHRPNPFGRDGLDSGSILVGAGQPPGGTRPARSRLAFSNWGSALDAQGWGRDVATTGGILGGPDEAHPGPDEDAWYTGAFGGTSSAAPIVAGALACVQGVLRAEGRTPLTPEQARDALHETGSEQPAADGKVERIGSLPDIGQLIEWGMDATRPARPTTPRRPRRRSMRVTITIDDDGDGPSFRWGGDETEVPYIRGPYIRGPYLYIPREDGPDAKIELAKAVQESAAAEEKPEG